ncbi:MAG: hypothetical protein P0107_04140 [Nitrosomonas sp.]|nr:hypothetical protein [Nitrosomonas sp.]
MICSRVVVPGQGAMPHMQALSDDQGLRESEAAKKQAPFLGICLGLQMLLGGK